ncbi:MAG: hypothetical protein R6U94_00955 [Nitriliruptoraceae bacterium]
MASKDDREALQRRFGALDSKERRSIVRAVNRGRAVEVRKHAPLAVHIAHRQMRFWKWSWVIGPAVGLLQIGQLGPVAAALNALLATALLGSMSAFFYLRAQRSAQANLALMGGKRPGPGFDAPKPGRRWWQRRGAGADQAAAADRGRTRTSDRDSSGTKAGSERTGRRWWGGRETRPATTAGSSGSQGHLPGRPRSAGGDTGDTGDGEAGPSTADERRAEPQLPPERRPYQPRGKKRRGR